MSLKYPQHLQLQNGLIEQFRGTMRARSGKSLVNKQLLAFVAECRTPRFGSLARLEVARLLLLGIIFLGNAGG